MYLPLSDEISASNVSNSSRILFYVFIGIDGSFINNLINDLYGVQFEQILELSRIE